MARTGAQLHRNNYIHAGEPDIASWPARDSLQIGVCTVKNIIEERPDELLTQERVSSGAKSLKQRVSALDWSAITEHLEEYGWAVTAGLLSAQECASIAALYAEAKCFRSRIVMERYRFGRGEYQYFQYPLPTAIEELRSSLYRHLYDVANRWNQAMGIDVRYPARLHDFLAHCHQAGQTRPTPLLLRYRDGDYNCLHQDLYGGHIFPLQAATLLSQPYRDFSGGEFVLTEQRPRMQSRAHVIPLAQGDTLIFAVQHRPIQGTRGVYRVNLRHGVSEIRSGNRYTLGVIFHDAR